MEKEIDGAAFKNKKWWNFLDKFHVYGGLFIAGYLIILGISSIQYQHHFKLPTNDSKKHWEQTIKLSKTNDDSDFKKAVRDSLGLFGYFPWWQDYKDDKGIRHFMISRPGKNYWIEVPVKEDLFKVKESSTGFLSMVMALHSLTGGGLEGPAFIFVWKIISQIMNVVFLFVLITSLYLWYIRSFSNYKGWILAGSFAAFSIIILIFIWMVG